MASGDSSFAVPSLQEGRLGELFPPAVLIQDNLPAVDLAFHPSCNFSTTYQRNNKSNGQKNLRCFPGHCFEGHKSGWCGHPLLVRVRGGGDELRLIGMFCPRFEPGEEDERNTASKFILGGILTKAELDEKLKSGILADWMEGFVEEIPKECQALKLSWESANQRQAPPIDCEREFVFNSKSKGWHYGFLGSKKDSNIWHVWSVFALYPSPDELSYTVLARLDSPPFQLFCRRRNRGPLARSRVESSQLISAVECKCIRFNSTPDEIAAASILAENVTSQRKPQISSSSSSMSPPLITNKSSSATVTTTAGVKKNSSSSSTSAKRKNSPPSEGSPSTLYNTSNDSHSSSLYSPGVGSLLAAVNATTGTTTTSKRTRQELPSVSSDEDKRMVLLLDLVRRVQLPSSSAANAGDLARRAAHSALMLMPGQDTVEFGERVLRFAQHWKQMELKGCPVPVQQAQQAALHCPPEDFAPPFASFLLGQQDFGEHVSLKQKS